MMIRFLYALTYKFHSTLFPFMIHENKGVNIVFDLSINYFITPLEIISGLTLCPVES